MQDLTPFFPFIEPTALHSVRPKKNPVTLAKDGVLGLLRPR